MSGIRFTDEFKRDAVSRAKGLALVFGAPRLREAKCNSVEQMQLVNTLCALTIRPNKEGHLEEPI